MPIRPNDYIWFSKLSFLQDNVHAGTSSAAAEKPPWTAYELLQCLPYSPNLAPCNYFLFTNLQKCFIGRRFASNKEFIHVTNSYLAELDRSYFIKDRNKFEMRRSNGSYIKGDYAGN